jgi:hypothetical protein
MDAEKTTAGTAISLTVRGSIKDFQKPVKRNFPKIFLHYSASAFSPAAEHILVNVRVFYKIM